MITNTFNNKRLMEWMKFYLKILFLTGCRIVFKLNVQSFFVFFEKTKKKLV